MASYQVSSNGTVIDKVYDDATLAACIADCRWGQPGSYTVTDNTTALALAAAKATAQAYLDSTDWQVIRQADSGVLIDPTVKAARTAARLVINPVAST